MEKKKPLSADGIAGCAAALIALGYFLLLWAALS